MSNRCEWCGVDMRMLTTLDHESCCNENPATELLSDRVYPYMLCPNDSESMDPLQGCSACKGVGYHHSIRNPEFVLRPKLRSDERDIRQRYRDGEDVGLRELQDAYANTGDVSVEDDVTHDPLCRFVVTGKLESCDCQVPYENMRKEDEWRPLDVVVVRFTDCSTATFRNVKHSYSSEKFFVIEFENSIRHIALNRISNILEERS